MKKISRYFILLLAVTALSCSQMKQEAPSCCSTKQHESPEPLPAVSGESLFLLDSKWETYRNDTLKFEDLAGKPVVAAMIFTNCPSACPRIVADMKILEEGLTTAEREQVRFLLISMDPKRDNPEQMQKFASDHRLNPDWIMIRSDRMATLEMANVLGVRINPLDDGGFDHSNTIHILNKTGEIAYQQHGLALEPTELLKQIRTLIN